MADLGQNPYAAPARTSDRGGGLRAGLGRVISVPLIIGGISGLYLQFGFWSWIAAQWELARMTSNTWVTALNAAIALFFAAIDISAIAGGVLLWRRRPRGRQLGILALATQLVVIVVPGFQYRVWMLALVGVGFVGGRLGVFLQSGTQMSLETEPVGWTFLVNAAAATALVALILARAPRPPTSPRS